MKRILPIVLLAAAVLAGCPKSQTVPEPTKEPLTETAPAAPFPEQPAPAPAAPPPAPAPAPAARPAPPAAGWRVQVFVSSTRENARKVAEEARWKFPEHQLFIAEQEPFYKVQVGNGLSRAQAEQLKLKAKELGFAGAFPVEVNP